MNPTTVVHTQFTGAHQLANIATDFPLTTADLGVKLNAYGQSHRYHDDQKRRHRSTGPCIQFVSDAAALNCSTTGPSPRATTPWCGA